MCSAATTASKRPRFRRTIAALGGHDSVAAMRSGRGSAPSRISASTSPPPVWRSRSELAPAARRVSNRAYPHGGRSSVARPSSHAKLQPSTGAAAASATRASKSWRDTAPVSSITTGAAVLRSLHGRPTDPTAPRLDRRGRRRARVPGVADTHHDRRGGGRCVPQPRSVSRRCDLRRPLGQNERMGASRGRGRDRDGARRRDDDLRHRRRRRNAARAHRRGPGRGALRHVAPVRDTRWV